MILGKCDGEKGEKVLLGHSFLQHLLWYLCYLHTTWQSWLCEFLIGVLCVKWQNNQTTKQWNKCKMIFCSMATVLLFFVKFFAAVIHDWRISINKEEHGPVNNPYSGGDNSTCSSAQTNKQRNKHDHNFVMIAPHPPPSPSCRRKGDQQLSALSKPVLCPDWCNIEISCLICQWNSLITLVICSTSSLLATPSPSTS